MLYNAPAKGDDGLYFVKALNDTKRKCLVQLNKVKVADVSGDMVFDLVEKRMFRRLVTLTHLTLRLLVKIVKLGSESNFLRK